MLGQPLGGQQPQPGGLGPADCLGRLAEARGGAGLDLVED